VAPILTYNCEIWSPHFIKIWMKDNHNSLLSSLEKFPFEKIQSKFCKWILGVNRYTSNIASRAELGVYPLLLYIFKHACEYITHLEKTNNSIIKCAPRSDKGSTYKSLWKCVEQIKRKLLKFHFGDSRISPNIDVNGDKLKSLLRKYYDTIFFDNLFNDKRRAPNQKE
jgi:hypothetical protein